MCCGGGWPLSRAQFGLTDSRPDHRRPKHLAVMAAIRLHDGAAAEDAMRRHLASVGRAFARWLDGRGPASRPERLRH